MIRLNVIYMGRVQGVGFRYTVRQYANQYGISGWVKNLPDGNVEMVVEGNESEIEELLSTIDSHFSGYIRNTKRNHQTVQENSGDFQIRY